MYNKPLLTILLLLTIATKTICFQSVKHHHNQVDNNQDQEAPSNQAPPPISSITSSSPSQQQQQSGRCQEITIPMCKSIRYNYTEMPNSFNHETQEEAGLEVHQYWPLVEIKCSDDLKFFICSLYVPICMEDYTGTVPPCRSVCERARAGCEPVMTQYGFYWPERMTCDQFPKFGKHSICMDEKGGEGPSSPAVIAGPGVFNNYGGNNKPGKPGGINSVGNTKVPSPQQPKDCNNKCVCTYPLVAIEPNSTINQVISTGQIKNCALPCHGYGYDSPEETRFANYWILTWSLITCTLSTLTVLSFLIDSNRFNYPERPIILISFCYIFVSLGYLIRIYYGHEATACYDSKIIRYPNVLLPHLGTTTNDSKTCTIVFLLTYYFTISGSIWYVVLTGTWYLASVLKWSTESINEKSGLFHTTVWLTSAAFSLTALLNNRIDGDSVSGICYIGNQDDFNLLAFVIIPMGSLLVLGTIFLVSGFVSLVRIRSVIAREVRNIHKLEKLMIRIGVFGVLYTVNVSIVLGCFGYESFVRREWVAGRVESCGSGGCGVVREVTSDWGGSSKPAYSVLMIKYFMSLATGLTASIWVFSSKTIETWKTFLCRLLLCFCCCGSSDNSVCSASNAGTSILTSHTTGPGGGGCGTGGFSNKQTHV